jgi:hypothetical protein
MKTGILVALVVACLPAFGCEVYSVDRVSFDANGDCIPSEMTRTRVPSISHSGDSIVLACSACNVDECNSLGARCEVEGAICDFYGKLGTCQGCCDSEFGELHCGLAK